MEQSACPVRRIWPAMWSSNRSSVSVTNHDSEMFERIVGVSTKCWKFVDTVIVDSNGIYTRNENP
jgi:hypothetical protein